MKTLLLVLIVCTSLIGQHPVDHQWYITPTSLRQVNEGYTINPNSNNPNWLGFQDFYISGEDHPTPEEDDAEYQEDERPRNDFFMIMGDGSFQFKSHKESSTELGYSYSAITSDDSNTVKYLYLTNGYEQDDPKGMVVPMPDQNLESLQDISNTIPPFPRRGFNGLWANQGITRNVDVTFIVKTGGLQGCTYNLCFDDITITDDGETNVFSEVVSSSSVFNSSCVLNGSIANATRQGLCFEGIDFHSGANFSYISLHFGDINPFRGKDVKFTLSPDDVDCDALSIILPIRDSHDPNFVEVKCVSENDCNQKYIRYYAQCMNDDTTTAYNVKIGLTLPEGVVEPVIFSVNTANSSYELDIQNISVSGRKIIFPFPSINLLNDKIAKVEFCVKLDDQFPRNEMISGVLKPSFPFTVFDDKQYTIRNYKDPAIELELQMGDASDLRRERFNTTSCNCRLCLTPFQKFIKWLKNLFKFGN